MYSKNRAPWSTTALRSPQDPAVKDLAITSKRITRSGLLLICLLFMKFDSTLLSCQSCSVPALQASEEND